MRSISLFAGFVLSLAMLAQPGTAQAQAWKPICVNGGATAGAHNGTWQKINTTGAGGGTWKKAGGCITPPPPVVTPPPPVVTPPSGPPADVFAGHSINAEPWGRNPYHNKGAGNANFAVNADGSWGVSGGPYFTNRTGINAASWRAAGYAGSEFEISWTLRQGTSPWGDFRSLNGGPYHQLTSTSAEGTWAPLDSGWWINLRDYSPDCYPERSTVTVLIDFSIRVKQNPSIARVDSMYIAAHGYDGIQCG